MFMENVKNKRSVSLITYVGDDDNGKEIYGRQKFSKVVTNATSEKYVALKSAIAPILKNPVVQIQEEQVNVIDEA